MLILCLVYNYIKKTLDFVKDEELLKSLNSTSERKLSVASEVDLKTIRPLTDSSDNTYRERSKVCTAAQ